MTAFLIVLALVALLVIVTLVKSVRVVQQQTVGIVERFGKFRPGLQPGLNLLIAVRRQGPLHHRHARAGRRVPAPAVITEDNLIVSIDSVIYFQVNDPVRATYEISNYIQAIEQLTMTTLRNIIGGMDLEQTLTSREEINEQLRDVLDEATGKWGIRVNRVELSSIDPPPSIQDSMEKQMRADRDKRAAILTAEGMRQSAVLSAEGQKQSAILTAEGDKQSRILRAEAERQARILKAQGEAQAITHGLQRDPRRQARPGAARVPVPADAAVDRPGRREQAVDRAERDRRRAQGSGQCGRPGGRHPGEGRGHVAGAGALQRRGAGSSTALGRPPVRRPRRWPRPTTRSARRSPPPRTPPSATAARSRSPRPSPRRRSRPPRSPRPPSPRNADRQTARQQNAFPGPSWEGFLLSPPSGRRPVGGVTIEACLFNGRTGERAVRSGA